MLLSDYAYMSGWGGGGAGLQTKISDAWYKEGY